MQQVRPVLHIVSPKTRLLPRLQEPVALSSAAPLLGAYIPHSNSVASFSLRVVGGHPSTDARCMVLWTPINGNAHWVSQDA